MKKKIVSSIIALTMTAAMVLSGCGSAASTPAAEAGNSDTEVADEKTDVEYGKLTIFQSKTEIMDQLNACVEDFSKETGIEVELWETSGDNYFTDLKTDLSTEAGPTLFSLAPGSESVEMADYLEDVSDLSFIDKVSAGMTDEVNGKKVGIPYTLEGFGLVYNANLADVATLTSTDALVDFLKGAKADGVNGLGFSQEDYFLIMHVLNTPFAIQDDPDAYLASVLAGETRMIDADAFKEFAKVMEAVRENCTNPVDITYDNNCGDFATGKTAMIHQGNWCYGMFADYEIDYDMGIAPLPICGNDKVAVSVPAAWYINTDATDGEKAAAKAFLEWLYTSEKGADYLMNQFGFVPVVEGMTSENLDPISSSVAKAAADGNTIPWNMANWPAGISSSLAPIVSEFYVSDMSGEELVNKLNDAFVEAAK
ncbi:MAG: extracellular solute-binding protein [Lachnospiraceae bacterium]|nr:extracellular solute-binding protein [Candidatus Colinaster equi]